METTRLIIFCQLDYALIPQDSSGHPISYYTHLHTIWLQTIWAEILEQSCRLLYLSAQSPEEII